METETTRPSAAEASHALALLSIDRQRLSEKVQAPWVLLAAFGGVAAWWVSAAAATSPGHNYEPPSSGWLASVSALVVMHLIRRETGIQFLAMGSRAGWALGGIIFSCLVLFSVSLGLVSLGLQLAVVLTSAAAFAVTTWLAGIAYDSAIEKLRGE
jgi:hypothetical protein